MCHTQGTHHIVMSRILWYETNLNSELSNCGFGAKILKFFKFAPFRHLNIVCCSFKTIKSLPKEGHRHPRNPPTPPPPLAMPLLIKYLIRCYFQQWEMQWPNGYRAGLWIEQSKDEPQPGHCTVFLGKTLYCHSTSLYSLARCINGYPWIYCWG